MGSVNKQYFENSILRFIDKAAVATAKLEMTAAMATFFSTTANFFRGDGKIL
jgi:hypothetical protein